jgi:hypothetical protein
MTKCDQLIIFRLLLLVRRPAILMRQAAIFNALVRSLIVPRAAELVHRAAVLMRRAAELVHRTVV